jgi:hypothetical protein
MNDPYAQTFQQESLRLSQPQLENSLIQRGLGGSSVYQGALTDLINKASTDAILNSSQLRNQNLASLQSSYFAPYQQLGQNLLQLAGGANTSQDQLAQSLYQALLPYTAQINQPKNNGLLGALTGAGQGFIMSGGNPFGALAGGVSGYSSSLDSGGSQSLMAYQLAQQQLQNEALLNLYKNGGLQTQSTNTLPGLFK